MHMPATEAERQELKERGIRSLRFIKAHFERRLETNPPECRGPAGVKTPRAESRAWSCQGDHA
jgi:hypothetical protein